MLITKKKIEKLEMIPYIWYPMIFKNQLKALLDLKSEINIISQVFTHQLGIKIRKTNIKASKIDGIILKIHRIVVFTFSILDKDDKNKILEKSFL